MTTKIKIGRSAVTGRFTTEQQAKQQPKTHVVETIQRHTTKQAQAKKR